jgi:putative ABC transport system permease protein
MIALLKTYSWQELRHHPWRNLAAVVAVMLGVALAFSVHLINASALDEFSNAVRTINGEPDLSVRGRQGPFDEAIFARVAQLKGVAVASPVLEITTYARTSGAARITLRVVGVDALAVARVAPALMPQPFEGADRMALFAPDSVFLNAAAAKALSGPTLQLQSELALKTVKVAGQISASGAPLGVMDLGAAQDLFGKVGQLSRIDLRLQAGVDRAAFENALKNDPTWPAHLTLSKPDDAATQASNLSSAYRVNLTVLALVALFTGAFLVFSVLSLSVAKRAQQFALLGVLGLSGAQRLQLILWESLMLGLLGSVGGIALGTALAALALRWLGGDLGGGYFTGAAPALQWSAGAACIYGGLGVAAALVGGWWPARQAQGLPLAQTLKGLGSGPAANQRHGVSLWLIAASAVLAWMPAIGGVPIAAYVSVALLLLGGITALPWLVGGLLELVAPWVARFTLPLLAVERARRVRETAAVAVSGVVASLSLAIALTVMVASFRDSVTQWLDRVLPADLYVRSASSLSAGETVYFSPALVAAVAQLQGVQRVQPLRQLSLLLDPTRPPVVLIARPLDDPDRDLPLIQPAMPIPAGQIGIYVSEAMVDLFDAQPGTVFTALNAFFRPLEHAELARPAIFFVAGVWRDYARQTGTIALDKRTFESLTGDVRANDLALWLQSPTDTEQVQNAIRTLADPTGSGVGALLEFGSSAFIRATSLKIFDRSFAVTYWLQAIAIGIGLFGVAASFSAQVLARRKEFGLLSHLGLTRRQILSVVALEGAAWTILGALAGLALGLGVAVVLVKVVNPQSFHWTMDMMLPWARLLALCGAVVVAGTLTAWLAGRAAASKDAVLAVKEDW